MGILRLLAEITPQTQKLGDAPAGPLGDPVSFILGVFGSGITLLFTTPMGWTLLGVLALTAVARLLFGPLRIPGDDDWDDDEDRPRRRRRRRRRGDW